MELGLERRNHFFDEQCWYAKTFLQNYLPVSEFENLKILEVGSAEGGTLKFFMTDISRTVGKDTRDCRSCICFPGSYFINFNFTESRGLKKEKTSKNKRKCDFHLGNGKIVCED